MTSESLRGQQYNTIHGYKMTDNITEYITLKMTERICERNEAGYTEPETV